MVLVLLCILKQFSVLYVVTYCAVELQKCILFQRKSSDGNLQITQPETLLTDIFICKFYHLEVEL